MRLCFAFVLETVLIKTGFVAAEQCSHKAKASCAPHCTAPAKGLGVCKELGGDIAGTADPD